jgi:hypothetical protein
MSSIEECLKEINDLDGYASDTAFRPGFGDEGVSTVSLEGALPRFRHFPAAYLAASMAVAHTQRSYANVYLCISPGNGRNFISFA